MPNYMSTRCRVSGSKNDVSLFYRKTFSNQEKTEGWPLEEHGKKFFDFNKIIPMPELILKSSKRNSGGNMRNHIFEESAIITLALNDTHGIIDAMSKIQTQSEPDNIMRNSRIMKFMMSGREGIENYNMPPINAIKGNVEQFLNGIDKKTGISTHPMSRDDFAVVLKDVAPDVSENIHLQRYGKIIAMMAGLEEEEVSHLGFSDLVRTCVKKNPGIIETSALQIRILAETGFLNWYDWSIVNWGTKWNSTFTAIIEMDKNNLEFTMETAWSFPTPVFKKLGEMFPEMKIWCACIDPAMGIAGWGYFTDIRATEPGDNFASSDQIDIIEPVVFAGLHEVEEPHNGP